MSPMGETLQETVGGGPREVVPPATLQEVTHFAKYFMGCYGFRITVFLHPLNGLCRLLPFCGGCCNTPRPERG